MAKPNLTSKPLAFDDFVGGSPMDTAQRIFQLVESHAEEARSWYWRSIRGKRHGSLIVRTTSYVAVVLGSTAPIVAAIRSSTEERLIITQLGVACLVVGGMVLLADRLFGWSSGWLRYVTTVLAMERQTQQFRLDWAAYLIGKGPCELTQDDAKALFEIARRFEQEIDARTKEETDGWVAEFNSSMATLDKMTSVQREANEKAAQQVREAMEGKRALAQPGAIEVRIVQVTPLRPVKLELIADGRCCADSCFIGMSWAKSDLAPGLYTVRVMLDHGSPTMVEAMKVIPVQGGSCATLEFAF
jgi:hypothetical protein